MQFKYSDEWREELLKYVNNEDVTRKETMRLINLIDKAKNNDDVRVIETLLLAMKQDDMGGIDQSIINILSSVDYKVYYEVLFKLLPKYLNKFRYWDISLLEMTHGNNYSQEELEYIESIAKRYLDKETIKEIINSLDKDDLIYDYPFNEFYQLFQKLLKEKSEQ